MSDFRARIGRIKMKNGGADVHVIDRQPANPDGEDWRGDILRNAREVADFATEEAPLAGYVLVGLFGDGATSIAWRYDPEAARIPRALLPHWIGEVVRRDIISGCEARSVFNDMFEWVE